MDRCLHPSGHQKPSRAPGRSSLHAPVSRLCLVSSEGGVSSCGAFLFFTLLLIDQGSGSEIHELEMFSFGPSGS